MNVLMLMGICFALAATVLMAGLPVTKSSGHRVVVEFTSEEPNAQEDLLQNIEALLLSLGPRTQVAVVAHGGGLRLVHQPGEIAAARIARLAERKVEFITCAESLQRSNLPREALLPGVIVVDSGWAELVRRQAGGWSYLRGR
jgi:intracellular sulfur oxidation DsrE/DsrF family protein